MDENDTSFPGNGLPPMPGVTLPDPAQQQAEEPAREQGNPDELWPVGEKVEIGDLIPEEGLPIPEFRAVPEEPAEVTEEEPAEASVEEPAEVSEEELAEAPVEEPAEAAAEEPCETPAEELGKPSIVIRFMIL